MKFNELGRSMVEMLGVLAIIGVLSVGAISGYSTAMTKYKLNKQTEQISQLINAVIRYRTDLKPGAHSGLLSLIPYLRKLNEIPEEMMYPSTNNKYDEYLKDSFNNEIMVFHHDTKYTGITISLENNSMSRDTCKNIYLLAKNFSPYIEYMKIVLYSESASASQNSGISFGDYLCSAGRSCMKDLKLTDIETICRACGEGTRDCNLLFVWSDTYPGAW